jgi:RHS repeat-associated protein
MKRNSGVNTPNEQGGKGSQKISQKAMSQSNERPLSAFQPSFQPFSLLFSRLLDASRVTSIATDGLSAFTSLSFGYDNANRKTWEDQTLNGAFTRRVETLPDDDGNRGTLSVSGVPEGYAFTYDYTSRQQLFHINKTSAGHYFEYTYDKNGNLKQRQDVLQGGDSTIFDYDGGNRVTLCVQTGRNNEAFSRSNYNDYDLVNNLKSVTREEDNWKGERFEYDDANQLKSASYRVDVAPHAPEQPDPVPGQLGTVVEVSEDSEQKGLAELVADPDREPLAQKGGGGSDAPGPGIVTYLNDSHNRLSMNDNGTVTNYTPNSLNQYTAVGNHTPLYDTKFNLLSGYDDWVYTYDADKRLISADSAAGQGHHAQFVYDGLGRCVKRTIDGAATVFTYDEWKPIVEWTGAGVFVAWNLYGPVADEILVRYQPNTGYYVHYKLDPMGNVQFLLSGQNYGLEKYTYDAFGKPHIVGANGDVRGISLYGNRFLFTGREYLYTLGIYDYRHRLYHPGLGRFIQTDPIGFGGDPMNLYRYCSGNPVLHGDPTGLWDSNSNNKSSLTSFGGGDWVTGSDGLSDRDRHDHHDMGSGGGADGPKSLSPTNEGSKQGASPHERYARVLKDAELRDELKRIDREKIAGKDLKHMTLQEKSDFLRTLDSKFRNGPAINYQGSATSKGIYHSSEVNYIGVGMGFAALGWPRPVVGATILYYKATQWHEVPTYNDFRFTSIGYNYYNDSH